MTATSKTTSTTPYADQAESVLISGLGSPLPVPYGQKTPPPNGYTGATGRAASGPDVYAWIESHGSANIAVRLHDGIVGIDVDVYHGGNDTRWALEAERGDLPDTLIISSRNDGSGIRLYRCPAGSHYRGVLGQGVEVVQHDHRYAMWRGSLHPNGGTYRTLDERTGEEDGPVNAATLPELPARWHELMQDPAAVGTPADYTGSRYEAWDDYQRRQVDEHARQRVNRVLADLRAAQAWKPGETDRLGRGWDKLCADAAQTLRTLARDGWSAYNEGALLQAYLAAAPSDDTFGEREHRTKWRTQTKPAVNGGRILPPSFDEMVTTLAEQQADEIGDDDRNAPLDWAALLEGPEVPPDFIVGQLLERGQQMALVGAAKVGKSLLSLDWAACIAAGKPFLGDEGREPLRVLYIDHENTQSDLRRRVRALGYSPADLANLTYLSFPTVGNLDTIEGAANLRAELDRFAPDVVFLDTVSRMISGPENDSDTWLNLYRLTLKHLKARRIALVRLDHFGKDTDRGARGSSAKEQDVDQVWELKAAGRTTFDLKRTHSRTGSGEEFIRFERETDEAKSFVRHVRPDRAHAGAFMFETYSATVLDAVKQLEAAPPGIGRTRLIRWALENHVGLMLRNDVWNEVVKCRNEVAEALSEDS